MSTDVGASASAVAFIVKFTDAVDELLFERDDRQFGYLVYRLGRLFDKVAREYDSSCVYASRFVRSFMLEDVNVFVSENLSKLSELPRQQLEKIFSLAFRLRYELDWKVSRGFRDTCDNGLFSRRVVCVCRLNDRDYVEKYGGSGGGGGGDSSGGGRLYLSASSSSSFYARSLPAYKKQRRNKRKRAGDDAEPFADDAAATDGKESGENEYDRDRDDSRYGVKRRAIVAPPGGDDNVCRGDGSGGSPTNYDDRLDLPRADVLNGGAAVLRWTRHRVTLDLATSAEKRWDAYESADEVRRLVDTARCTLDSLSPRTESCCDAVVKGNRAGPTESVLLRSLTLAYAKFSYLEPLFVNAVEYD